VKLRVVTYNIHRAIGLDRRFRPERIVDVLAHHDADMVLLQEVDEGAPRSRELDLAKELATSLGYPHYAVGHNVSLRKGRYGNATLSRYPIVRERNIDLTVMDRKRRGCQHTTIEIDKAGARTRSLELFNLHLGLSAREREIQAGILARSQEITQLTDETLAIIGGDFNDWRSLLRTFFVHGLGFACATDRDTLRGPVGIRTYPSFSPQGSIDKVYYRGPLRPETVQGSRHRAARVASDHLPVVVEFELA